jgi:hypothetical protein
MVYSNSKKAFESRWLTLKLTLPDKIRFELAEKNLDDE